MRSQTVKSSKSSIAPWLNDNNLSGSIPPELGSLSSLHVLDLDENRLTGSIPPALGDLGFPAVCQSAFLKQ
ncbi:MAG: hypothetical protein OXE73_13795 [Gammaproteobacteria bacterium]|nr:hypothetical protein [Gammaproteobacteria bacterium]